MLDLPAKVLLVQTAPGQRFHRLLELQQREFLGHQLEHHRPVFDLGTQPRHGGRENAPVVMTHALPGQGLGLRGFHNPVAQRLRHESRLEQQLIALQHQLFVPLVVIEPEHHRHALQTLLARGDIRRAFAPLAQTRQDGLVDQRRLAAAPIFPGEIAIPIVPPRLRRTAAIVMLARQPQIADGDGAHAQLRRPIPIRKGVELLDIAERMVRLRLHPRAQAGLQRAVLRRERPRRQRGTVARGEHPWLAIGDCHQHRHQIGLNQMLLLCGGSHRMGWDESAVDEMKEGAKRV